MSVEIDKKEDFLEFKSQLMSEITKLIKPINQLQAEQWLKSAEVQRFFK